MNDRNDELARLADEFQEQLLADYPNEALWMLQMHPVRALWGGGFDLLGQTYATAAMAIAAQRATIMTKLAQIGAPQL
jgi:hypothetical protein